MPVSLLRTGSAGWKGRRKEKSKEGVTAFPPSRLFVYVGTQQIAPTLTDDSKAWPSLLIHKPTAHRNTLLTDSFRDNIFPAQ